MYYINVYDSSMCMCVCSYINDIDCIVLVINDMYQLHDCYMYINVMLLVICITYSYSYMIVLLCCYVSMIDYIVS